MPALMATEFKAVINWIGRVSDRGEGMRSEAVEAAELTFDGLVGEAHGGRTRASDVRVLEQHERGTEIANVRQLSVLSAEEIALSAQAMGLAGLEPAWLGASLVIEGIGDFSHVPPSSRLQAQSGATLVIDMQNRPCLFPAKEIEREHEGFGKAYKPAAKGRRGVTAWVERPGAIALGDELVLHVPDQRVWEHWNEARGV
ncbi:MOSC domain-containing protein [Lentibacter algarum]|uniref:MOSC domain-containing protein n=1 Tax=Lentibacter algarum TaxID=576131 RepID=UPI001C0A617D|nr:MOSC domain-containing protein [Lentibacter algarum]MBU2982987.1 MOSC domain-containing protein [Lentibacter algarum]